MIPALSVCRYAEPMRQGSSLPALVEANDGQLYVVKFAGAGQGPRALIAEYLGGEIARRLGLPVPELAFIDLPEALNAYEPDGEIQALLRASVGTNLGLRFLPNAFTWDPLTRPAIDPDLAADIVWLDAFITNVDRTARNVNLLTWQRRLWLIDHGAAFYGHYTWERFPEYSLSPFPRVRQHVLLPFTSSLAAADSRLKTRLDTGWLQTLVDSIPEAWLRWEGLLLDQGAARQVYADFLRRRIAATVVFVEEAEHARTQRV